MSKWAASKPDDSNGYIHINSEDYTFGDIATVHMDNWDAANMIAAAPEMYKEIEQDIEILTRQCASCVLGSHELRHLQLRIKSKKILLAKARGEQ